MNRKKEYLKLFVYSSTTLLIAIVIFFFSSQPAKESSQASGYFMEMVIAVLGNIMPEALLSFLIRKAAHITIYFLLGWSMTLLVGQAMLVKTVSIQVKKMGLTSLVFCFLYACSDEWHQTFVPGRDGAFRDVCIDGIGFCCSIILVLLWKKRREKRKETL